MKNERFALGDANLDVVWKHFGHNRSFFIDDFALPRNTTAALEIVYVSAGFWIFTPRVFPIAVRCLPIAQQYSIAQPFLTGGGGTI